MNVQLLITNIGFGVSLVVSICLAVLVFIKRPKENPAANILYFLAVMSISVWQISFLVGTNLVNPEWSRIAFMFNLSALTAVLFQTHMTLVLTNRIATQKKAMAVLYGIGAIFFVYFLIFPMDFMLTSVSKMYFPNYFVLGPGYGYQDTFFFFVLVYMLWQFFIGYHRADVRLRNRLKYVILATIYGYVISLISEFLMYDIEISPIISSLTGLYTIPMAYAILKYDSINISILAKRAFGYAVSVAAVSLLVFSIGYANELLTDIIPGFPAWILPLISGVIAVSGGYYVWKKIKETDVLKYQFIDIVTHKFRHPLTYIRWSAETLRSSKSAEEKEEALSSIEKANAQLFNLTRTLTDVAESGDESAYVYSLEKENLRELVEEAVSSVAVGLNKRGIVIENNVPSSLPKVLADRTKLELVIQMILENAIIYSPQGGKVILATKRTDDFLTLSIRDFGIGISEEDLTRLFSKFFRAEQAQKVHTEGMGVGLFLARGMMQRQGGDLRAESDGPGKGTTFFIKVPVVK